MQYASKSNQNVKGNAMEKTGYIEIRMTGNKGNLELSPENFDIKELIPILENVEKLLFPNDKKNRPNLSYKVENGSVKHIFQTAMQFVIGFNAILGQVVATKDIDFLDLPTAKAFEYIQEIAKKKDYSIAISTSIANTNEIQIDKNTNYLLTETIWADAEFYFYGKITNAGGKDKANIHILTEEFGTIRVQTPIKFLEEHEENILYKSLGIRAKGKQNVVTGELDTSNITFIELLNYQPVFDKEYLNGLRAKAKESWNGISPEKWLSEIRGYA